jgi:hypothetical protein
MPTPRHAGALPLRIRDIDPETCPSGVLCAFQLSHLQQLSAGALPLLILWRLGARRQFDRA